MTEKTPAAEYAALRGIPETAVIHNIKAGIYEGVEENGAWFVIRRIHVSEQEPSPKPERVPAPKRPSAPKTKKVVRYTSRVYVNTLMILLGILVFFDLYSLIFSGESESIRGIGLRVGVFVALWVQHRWARLAVQVWAGFLVIAGTAGLYWLLTADPTEYTVAWWGPFFFGSFVIVGLSILLTAHRFIKVEEVQAETQ